MSDGGWQESAKGNWYRKDSTGAFVTIFRDQRSGDWKYVCDGQFSNDSFEDINDAMAAADEEFG